MSASKVALILSSLSLIAIGAPPQQNDKLAFVYEAVRHGARAPLMDEPPGYFQVPS